MNLRDFLGIAALAAVLASGCATKEPTPAERAAAAVQRGDAAVQAGDLATAEQAYAEAVALAPTAPGPHVALGVIRMRQGKDSQAILDLKRAAELAPSDPVPKARLGDAYLRLERYELAAPAYEQAVQLGDERSRPSWSRSLLRAGKLPQAAEAAEASVRADGTSGPALAALADVRLAQGDELSAAKFLDEAVRASADDYQVRMSRARFFLRRERLNEALVEAQEAQRLAPSAREAAVVVARALTRQAKFDDAGKALSLALQARPGDPELLALRAEVRLAAGDGAGAKAAAEKALERAPRNPLALFVRAQTIEQIGDPAAAVSAYEEAVAAGAGTDALSRLAKVYVKRGSMGDALATYERLLSIEPGRYEDAVDLCALRGEIGVKPDEGLKTLQRLKGQRPEDAGRLEQIEGKLRQKAAAQPKRKSGPVIMRGR